MKRVLLGLLLVFTLTSCENAMNSVVQEEIVFNQEAVTRTDFTKEVLNDKQYYASSSLGLPNYVYIENCYFSGEGNIDNILDWSGETSLHIKKEDYITLNFEAKENVRSIELINDGIETIQVEFSNNIVKTFDLENHNENQSIIFETPILSKSIKFKVIKAFNDSDEALLTEIHLISDLKLSAEDYLLVSDKNQKIDKIQKEFKWTNQISNNKDIVKEVIDKFTLEEIIALSEEIDMSILQSKLDKFIGYPLTIKGKVLGVTSNDSVYELRIKSLIDQKEYLVSYDTAVENNSLVSISGIVLGRDADNRIVIYGIK